ncbi:MAG: hypothetical protein WDW36_006081 [Sanguina aurantia]
MFGRHQQLRQLGSTVTQAVFNVVNVMMGVGLLSLPFALKSSGWIGIGLLWLMGFVANYTGKALVQCANTVAKQRNLGNTPVGYEDIAEAAFGKIGKLVISSIIYVELFGTCALLFILEGDNLFKLMGDTLFGSAGGYLLLAAAIMIPTVWLPDLGSLAFLGLAGFGATCTVAASVAYTLATGSFVAGAATNVALWASLPLVFGIMTFCYSGHGVFPAIQASMKDPKQFPKVLDIAYLIVGLMCTFVGGAGYYMYGANAADIVSWNLPAGFIATLCSCVILINPFAKFALTMEPISAAAQSAVSGGGKMSGLPRALLRTALAIAILMAARSLPYLAYVMALVGGESSTKVVAWNWFVAVLGMTCTLFGTAASIKSLAAKAASVSLGAA